MAETRAVGFGYGGGGEIIIANNIALDTEYRTYDLTTKYQDNIKVDTIVGHIKFSF